MSEIKIKPTPKPPEGKEPDWGWFKEWEEQKKRKSKAKNTRKKSSELQTVQKPLVQLYYKAVFPKYPNSILIINPLTDMSFGKDGGKIMGMAKNMGFRNSQPDVIILQPSKGYTGLVMELKAEGKSPFKLNGEIRANDHLQAQYRELIRYQKLGYLAQFVVGFDEGEKLMKNYFDI